MQRWPALVLAIGLAIPCSSTRDARAQISAEARQRDRGLGRPAADGVALGGVAVGTPEDDVRARFGPPAATLESPFAEQALRWELEPGVYLDAHVSGGGVRALAVSAPGIDPPDRSPLTGRGLRLGMPVEQVVARYGPPTNGRLWYAGNGVAFNVDGEAPTVKSILIFRPGTLVP